MDAKPVQRSQLNRAEVWHMACRKGAKASNAMRTEYTDSLRSMNHFGARLLEPPLACLRQTNHTLQTAARMPAIDQLNPADGLSHICDRPTKPHGFFLACLRQTICPSWCLSRTFTTDQPHLTAPFLMVAINNLRICSQIKSTSDGQGRVG